VEVNPHPQPPSPYLSVIVPCYNEEQDLRQNLEAIIAFYSAKPYSWEICVVDDGSKDATPAILREFAGRDPRIRAFSDGVNRGKGAALRTGMLQARGEALLFFDIDLSTPLEETDRFLPLLKDHDLVIGARKHAQADIRIRQPKHREIMGKAFTALSAAMFVRGIHDVTCGFKCFQAEAGKRLFGLQKIDRWVFDTEILFLARRCGYRIAQVPVRWSDSRDSRVSLFRDTLGSFRDLLRIKLYQWRGRYTDIDPRA